MLSNNQVFLYNANNINMLKQQQQNIVPTQTQSTNLSNNNSSTSSIASSINSNTSNNKPLVMQRQSSLTTSNTNQQSAMSNSSNNNSNNPNQTSNPVQIQNYITWINSHLKKRPGVKLVDNLQTDLASGVALTHLIEIISGTMLNSVNMSPKTPTEYKENLEKILKFMQQSSIKMHQTTAKELLEGNLKSIMRLVLALAAHFKPTNVQPYSALAAKQQSAQKIPLTTSSSLSNANLNQNYNININKRSNSTNNVHTGLTKNQPNTDGSSNQNGTYVVSNGASQEKNRNHHHLDSMTHLVQAACVSLADVRRYKNENFNIKYVKRNTLLDNSPTINANTNQTYVVNNNNNNNHMMNNNTTFFSSPNSAQPIASSTILQAPQVQQQPRLYENLRLAAETTQAHDLIHTPPAHMPQPNHHSTMHNLSIIQKPASTVCKNLTYTVSPSAKPSETSKQIETTAHIKEEPSCIEKQRNAVSNSSSSIINNNITNHQINLHEHNNFHKQLEDIKEENQETSVINATQQSQAPSQQEHLHLQQQVLTNDIQHNLEDIETLNDVVALKKILLDLQAMMLNDVNSNTNSCTSNTALTAKNHNDNDLNDENNMLNSSSASSSNDTNEMSNLSKDEQICILKSRIQQLEILSADLRTEISQAKSELMNRNGMQSGLKTRINEQNNTILEMKNEELKLNLNYEKVCKENEELNTEIGKCLNEIARLKNDLLVRDDFIGKMKAELTDLKRHNNKHQLAISTNNEDYGSVRECLNKLRNVFVSNGQSQQIINSLEQHFVHLVAGNSNSSSSSTSQAVISADTNGISSSAPTNSIPSSNSITSSVSSLISSNSTSNSGSSSLTSSSANSPVLPTSQPQQQQQPSNVIIKTESNDIPVIEQICGGEGHVKKISRLFSQSSQTNVATSNVANNNNKSNRLSQIVANFETTTTNNSGPKPTSTSTSTLLTMAPPPVPTNCCSSSSLLSSSNVSSATNSSSSLQNVAAASSSNNTKCIYYVDKGSTPFMTTICKNIEQITLNDFKESVKLKPGNYVFRFKTLDPEFGVLKEEIAGDFKKLPAFENKIIAWVDSYSN